MFTTLRSRLIFSISLVVFVSLTIASLLFYQFLTSYSRRAKERTLRSQAEAIATRVSRLGSPEAHILLFATEQLTDAQVFLVDQEDNLISLRGRMPMMRDGRMGSRREPLTFEEPQVSERYLPSLERDVLFVSVPVEDNPNIKAVVLTTPLQDIGRAQLPFFYLLLVAAALSFLIALAVGLYLASSISRPVHVLTEAADKVAQGDLSQVVKTTSQDEIGRLSRTFNYMVERLRRTYEAQRDFTSNVSHELRTPLTSIEGYSEALLEGVARDKESVEKSLKIINEESKRLKRLTESLLTLSRIDAGALELDFRKIKVKNFIEKIGEKLRPQIQGAKVDLKLKVASDVGQLRTDPDRLEQVIINLLDNAFRNSPHRSQVLLKVGRDLKPNLPPQLILSL